MKTVTKFALLSAAIVSAPFAMAHEAGDMFVRGGLINVMPDESSTGLDLGVGNDLQVGLTATYMYSDNVGIELLAATPFTHDVTLAGAGKIGEVSHLPPSLMAQYYFSNAESTVRPYVGAGLNYTVFFDEETTGAIAGTDLDLDNSFGLALQAGVDYNISKNLFVNASLWYMDISTDVKLDGVKSAELDIDPLGFMASVGYTF
ncbi:Outer membrane protein W precursor [Marinomonas gallaica]|uniref:Outer membrane protein W n=1 Tax=Marinomonas gallaica TaxID=1806667 RepID=A0A1C3JR38_9GAMM|nr:OmpW family outer membrane protein [Marinomonas gallaica]SBT17567.1 Outer membrane protein W precursor [Marinomonas gallaica]SBT19759.1 Outer membrane protein W precursor [Marinomonas gallaica]